MLIASLLLVLASVAVVFANATAESGLPPGYQYMIHARIPWLVLAPLIAGCALGVASLVRRRSILRFGAVGLELVLGGLLVWYFTVATFLPPHSLTVAVGEPFPGYALRDHTGELRERAAGAAGSPALYIFYRGHW